MTLRTKIVCTMGPSVRSYEKIIELIDAGMNVARLNFSHGSYEDHLETIQFLKKARSEKKVPLAIVLDVKGPKIRIGNVKPEGVAVQPLKRIRLVKNPVENHEDTFQMIPPLAFSNITLGQKILIDDGYVVSEVVEIDDKGITIEIKNSGVIKSNKGINIPDCKVDLPAMTQKDIDDITFGCKNDIDIIAASFIRSDEHVIEIKKLLSSLGKPDIKVIAKIESSEGVENFDAIVQVADGIMVARGDLGVEMALEKVPSLQKMMIRSCHTHAKPVVTATQMLESMIKNPRPTRAEVSDVANAIYDGTSAVMLSGETAVGLYPIEAVKIMKSIIKEAEEHFDFKEFLAKDKFNYGSDVSPSISYASVKTAYNSSAKAIFAFTNSGFTVRLLSKFKPEMPIVALSESAKVYHQMSLLWGVVPAEPFVFQNQKEAFEKIKNFSIEKSLVSFGDLVVITSGSAFGLNGSTNTMMVDSIGHVILRGKIGWGRTSQAPIAFLLNVDLSEIDKCKDTIVVMTKCDERYIPFLKNVKGIILQSNPYEKQSENKALEIAKSQNIPVVLGCEGALDQLKEGQMVTIDPSKGIVF